MSTMIYSRVGACPPCPRAGAPGLTHLFNGPRTSLLMLDYRAVRCRPIIALWTQLSRYEFDRGINAIFPITCKLVVNSVLDFDVVLSPDCFQSCLSAVHGSCFDSRLTSKAISWRHSCAMRSDDIRKLIDVMC